MKTIVNASEKIEESGLSLKEEVKLVIDVGSQYKRALEHIATTTTFTAEELRSYARQVLAVTSKQVKQVRNK